MLLFAMIAPLNPEKNDGATLQILLMRRDDDLDEVNVRAVEKVFHGTCARMMCSHPDLASVHHVCNGDYTSPVIETGALTLAEALECYL